MLTLHYVQKHRPIAEMAKLYQPAMDVLNTNYGVTENPIPGQEGIPCPFITGSLQLCPKKFVIERREMTKLIEHVLSHIPNIILEKVSELIQAASKIYQKIILTSFEYL